jgi:hypothetical protein
MNLHWYYNPSSAPNEIAMSRKSSSPNYNIKQKNEYELWPMMFKRKQSFIYLNVQFHAFFTIYFKHVLILDL